MNKLFRMLMDQWMVAKEEVFYNQCMGVRQFKKGDVGITLLRSFLGNLRMGLKSKLCKHPRLRSEGYAGPNSGWENFHCPDCGWESDVLFY